VSEYKDQIIRDWSEAPYYPLAETSLWPFWSDSQPFSRMFNTLDLADVVELACGHGRHAAYIRQYYVFGSMTLVDVNASNVAYCRDRFAGDNRIRYLVNSGSDLQALDSGIYSAAFCYDAMVHFEYDDALSYVGEFYRILRPGGRALLHHSNYDKKPGARYSDNPHWRNFMSASLFAHAAMRAGFTVVEQRLIDWGETAALDCATLLAKPAELSTASHTKQY
jgi:SAM-dependent methyltransferase